MYRIGFQQNDLVSIAVINETPIAGPVNPVLRIFDTNGTTVLRTNDDTRFGSGVGMAFSGNSFGQAGDHFYVNGSILLNFPVMVPGNYFVEVSGFGGTSTGNYELFIMGQAVPEPTTIAMIGLSVVGAGFVWYRHRRQRLRASEA